MALVKRFFFFILTSILVSLTVAFIVSAVTRYFGIQIGGGYAGMFTLCLIYGFAGSIISLLMSRWMAKQFHGVQVIDPNTTNPMERRFVDKVYKIARLAGMETMPEVGIYQSAEVNAFATGPSRKRSLVAVSTGLLNTMTDDEIEGVLAHEVAHIVNGDMVTMTLIQGVINAFAMFISMIITNIIMSAFRRNDDDRPGFGDFMFRQMIYSIVSIVVALFGSIIVNYFSRYREFRADAGGARFSSREKMTSALQKLQKITALPQAASSGEDRDGKYATLKISSGPRSGFMRLFMTHPPLEERIAALQNASR